MDKKEIVLLATSNRHKQDRAWLCANEAEALRMVRWLRDNRIKAEVMTVADHVKLADYEE